MRLRQVMWGSIFLGVLLAASWVDAAEDARRDGNWWQQQTPLPKVAYVTGFFDGMDLGNKFSYWKYAASDGPFAGRAVVSFGEYSAKYFNNVTSGQIVDGLDTFFKDYRNRRILVNDAVWLVVNGIAGTPQEELDKMIESWRRNAR